MPASMATKLGIQFARFAQYTAASSNAGTHGLRSAFANAGPGPTWAPGLSSSGTGVGGAKFQAGKGAHSSFQQSGKALANANASSSSDGTSGMNDEDDDVSFHSPINDSRHQLSPLYQRQTSLLRVGVQRRLIDPASPLHLIMPTTEGARPMSTTKAIESPTTPQHGPLGETEETEIVSHRIRHRSLSTSAAQTQELPVSSRAEPMSMSGSGGILVGQRGEDDEGETFGLKGDAELVFSKLLKSYLDQDINSMRSNVEDLKKQPKDAMSTESFELAMRILRRVNDMDVSDRTIDLYRLMIESDCAPNTEVYGHVARALCARDVKSTGNVKRRKSDDSDYHEALNFLDIVHATSDGFARTSVYNAILGSCSSRGDAETACLVIDRLSSNKKVTPSAYTFRLFLESFARDKLFKPGESEEEFNLRRHKACEHVLKEAEHFRKHSNWDIDQAEDAKIFNSMIRHSILSGHSERAIEIVGKMVNGEALYEGGLAAPHADEGTTKSLIVSFTATGDLESAVEWVQKIVEMNERCRPGEVPSMALPDAGMITELVSRYVRMLYFLVDEARVRKDEDVMLGHLKMIESANKLLLMSHKMTLEPSDLEIKDMIWRTVLDLNNRLIEELVRQDRLAEANVYLDFCLVHIEKHITRNEGRLCWAVMLQRTDGLSERMAKESELTIPNLRSIIKTTKRLVLVDRRTDAASCLTWLVALTPPASLGSPFTGYTLNAVVDVTQLITKLVADAAGELYEYVGRPEDVSEHLMMVLRYIILSVGQIGLIPYPLNFMVSTLYEEAKKGEQEGNFSTVSALEPRERNMLLDCLFHAGRGEAYRAAEASKDIDEETISARLRMLKMLMADLAALPEAERKLVNLNKAVSMLPHYVPQEVAEEMLQAIRPSFAFPAAYPAPAAKPEEEAASKMASPSNESTVASSSLPPTADSSVDETFTAPASQSTASFKHDLPTLQTVDVDLGTHIERSVYASLSKKIQHNEAKSKEMLLRAYEQATSPPEEAGVYPSPNGFAALMDAFGRRGDLDRVRKAYEMGSYVVSCLSGDPQWQSESWYLIENGMIAALAHGGDVNEAMERRHRLVNAGRAPSADTYGALITVIRETTDEALVAEELYEESQRLGVVPTRYLYNTVLSKLSRARKTERAMQIFDEMRNRGVVASSITYGAILNACTRTGDEINAERFFAMMESDTHFKPMAPPYNTMIQLYTQTKPIRERALHYYKKMLNMGVEHTGYTYKLLLDVYGSIEPVDIQGMKDVFGQIIADPLVKVQGNHWASMISAYGIHCNDLDEAIRLYEAIPNHVATVKAGRRGLAPDALSFEALMTVFASHKRLDLLEKYIEERRKVPSAEFTAYVANVIIKAYSTLLPEGGLDKARAVFEEMVDPPMGVAAHGNHPLQRQHVSGAHHETIEEDRNGGARKTAFQLIKREPSTFEAMIRAEVEHNNEEQASALIHRMQQRGYPPVVVARAQDILTHHYSL